MSSDIRISQATGLETYLPDRLHPLMRYLLAYSDEAETTRVLRWYLDGAEDRLLLEHYLDPILSTTWERVA